MSSEISNRVSDLQQSLESGTTSEEPSSSSDSSKERIEEAKKAQIEAKIVEKETVIEEKEYLFLSEAENPKIMLTKVALLFIVYFAAISGLCAYIWLDVRSARILYRTLSSYSILIVSIVLVVLIKLAAGFAGGKIQGLLSLLFLVDLIFSSMFMFSLYFKLETANSAQYVYNCFYVIMVSIGMLGSSVGFFLSTIASKKRFNPVLSTLLMVSFNSIFVILFAIQLDSVMVRTSRIVIVIVCSTVVNIYISFNASQFLMYRLNKFRSNDTLLIFFTFWTDWMYVFWYEIIDSVFFAKKKGGKKQQNNDIESGRPQNASKKGKDFKKEAKKNKVEEVSPHKTVEKDDELRSVEVSQRASDADGSIPAN